MLKGQKDKLLNGEALSKEKFKIPSREFGIFPFWFWNGEMSYEEMEYQLKEFYSKGIPGIFIHARFGINDYIPYLSDDWFDRVKFTVEKAREMGLQVWVYDEYNWPSGTAGKNVMKKDPDLTQRYLELIIQDNPGQFFTFLEGTDSRYVDMEESEPVYACAILEEDLKNGRPNFVDLMPSLSFDKVITWETPKGPWKLFYFIERKASWYIDTLDENATEEFLKLTHERYKKAMNGDFAGKIGGFYTDEPAMHYFEVGKDNYIIPWSKKAFKIYKEYNGYDLRPHLPKLFFDIGEDTAQVRYDFWNAFSKQYEKTYYAQIEDWCRKNDVTFTGHLLYEEFLRMHARCEGNLFNYLKHLDLTGVDHLYPRIGTPQMPEEHVALKIASSAAHQFGSTRLLCESMGGTYWDVTMERMKWIADWEYVLGVNILNPHGFHYSIEGERKRDWPPSQFYHHTWWKYYGLFNEYISRMSYMLSGGKHAAKAVILYPINSMWTNYTPQASTPISEMIQDDFNYLTDTMLRLHIDFDYIDEDVLKEAEIKGGKLCIRGEEYSLLILPPITHIKDSTMKTFEDFYNAGGKILGDTLLPYESIEGKDPALKDRVQTLFGKDPLELKEAFKQQAKNEHKLSSLSNNAGGKVVFMDGPGLNTQKSMETLRSAILECIEPDIEIDNTDVFYLHRVKDDKDFYFLINPVDNGKTIAVSIHKEGAPELWNLESGDVEKIHVYSVSKGITTFQIYMQPYGSAMISLSHYKKQVHAEASNITITNIQDNKVYGYGRLHENAYVKVNKQGEIKQVTAASAKPLAPIEFGSKWRFVRDIDNALLINNWKFTMDEKDKGEEEGYYISDFDDSSWLDFTMGAWEMQLPEERDKKTYPITLWYRTVFDVEYIPDDIKLMIDGFKGIDYKLYINGIHVTDTPVRSAIDAEIKQIMIKKYVKSGCNSVVIKLQVGKKSDGVVDILKIMGSFALKKVDERYVIGEPIDIISTGSWVEQGYPYFSGTGEYTQNLVIHEEHIGKCMELHVDCGTDISEVYVNGERAGIRMWNPYTIDVTPYIKAGRNTFTIKVTNTLINLLEAVEQPSGVFKAALIPYNKYELGL